MKSTLFLDKQKVQFAEHHSISLLLCCLFLLTLSIGPAPLHAQNYVVEYNFNNCPNGCNDTPGILSQARDGTVYGTLYSGGSSNCGSVYKFEPGAGLFYDIHDFSGPDGCIPVSGLTLGTDGNFYGVTYQGGANDAGTIFQITPAGTLTTLHHFTTSEGCCAYYPPVQGKKALYGVTSMAAYKITPSGNFSLLSYLQGTPNSPLVLASNGNLYGTTILGGSYGYGTVFQLSLSGALKTIYNFDYTHGAYPHGIVVQGSDGYLYGTCEAGGTATHPGGVVFKLSVTGSITVLTNFDSTSITDGYQPLGLVAATDGTFYGVTPSSQGGPADYGTLFGITGSGAYSNLHDFDLTHGAYPFTVPMQHTNGYIYGTTSSGGANNRGVFWHLDNGIVPFVSIVGVPSGTVGQTVEVLGQNFIGASGVRFGSGSASFNIVSDTYMTAKVPSSGTTGPVTVIAYGQSYKSKQTFKVIPLITMFSPASGPGGSPVTITGSGFKGATQVTFNGVKASFTINSGTKITATVPSGATTGKIKVTTAGGTATSKGIFTVT